MVMLHGGGTAMYYSQGPEQNSPRIRGWTPIIAYNLMGSRQDDLRFMSHNSKNKIDGIQSIYCLKISPKESFIWLSMQEPKQLWYLIYFNCTPTTCMVSVAQSQEVPSSTLNISKKEIENFDRKKSEGSLPVSVDNIEFNGLTV